MAPKKSVKYIFVLGGVISGLGKGIAAASIGYLLKYRLDKKYVFQVWHEGIKWMG